MTTLDHTNTSMAASAVLEKPELDICFIPIICAAPLIYAHSHSVFARHGLNVNLRSAPGWSGIKELMVYEKVDAVHMLAPMPLACNLGLDGKRASIKLTTVQNVNGQALTLSTRHLGIGDVREMRGFTFGVPYRFSIHYYLLCFFLAQHGLHPLKEVTITEIAPPLMPYYLEQGWVDGVFAPEPFNQIPVHRGTGYIYILSKDIWPGHPCCTLATSQDFIDRYPNTYRAMLRSVIEAEWLLHASTVSEKQTIAREIAAPGYLGQDDPVPVQQVLSGEFPDGRGGSHSVPDRIDFIPFPWESYGMWILSQMERWGQLHPHLDYRDVVEAVFDTDTPRDLAEALGFKPQRQPPLPDLSPQGQLITYDGAGATTTPDTSPRPYVHRSEHRYHLPEPASERLRQILSQLADVAGGSYDLHLELTSDDEIGMLEHMLNEMVLNMRFARENLIERFARESHLQQHIDHQHAVMLEQATPIVPLLDGVLVMPLVGTIDTERAEQVMAALLHGVAAHRADIAIVDITGVQIVNTQVAQALISAAQGAKLLGAQVVLTGIQPQIATTLVQLGVDMGTLHTHSTLQSAVLWALQVKR